MSDIKALREILKLSDSKIIKITIEIKPSEKVKKKARVITTTVKGK